MGVMSQSANSDLDLLAGIAQKVDVRNAQATKEEDRTMIVTRIDEVIGSDRFLDIIRQKLSESIYLATLNPVLDPTKNPAEAMSISHSERVAVQSTPVRTVELSR